MSDKLAEIVARYIEEQGFSRIYELPREDYEAAKRLVIAALRRGPERPSSGEMVMVPRKVLADIEEGYRSRCEYCRGVKAACEELDVKYGISCLAREAWCALSAAEAEGRKS